MTFSKRYNENDVVKVLTDNPANPAVIAKRAGCSVTTVKRILTGLNNSGKVQRVEIETLEGVTYAWRRC